MIEDGKVYVFHLKSEPSKVIEVSDSDIIINMYKRIPSQRFQALKSGDYFMFKDLSSDDSQRVISISIDEGKSKEDAKILLHSKNESDDAQKWKVIKADSEYIYLQSKLYSNYCLDIKNGTNICLSKYNEDSNSNKFKLAFKEIYRFRVGVRGLFHLNNFTSADITHAVFLLGSDMFEYGVHRDAMLTSAKRYSTSNLFYAGKKINEIQKDLENSEIIMGSNGYARHKGVGRGKKEENGIDWDRIGEALNGTTWIQPDELEESILKSGEWTNEKYDIFNHNCHDFVRECLRIVGCHEGMVYKKLPVYRPAQKGGYCKIF